MSFLQVPLLLEPGVSPIIVMDLDLELGLEFAPPEKIPRKGDDANFSDDEGEGAFTSSTTSHQFQQ